MSCSYFRHCTVWNIMRIWLSPSTLPLCIPLLCLFVCFQVSILVKRFLITKTFTTKWMTLDSVIQTFLWYAMTNFSFYLDMSSEGKFKFITYGILVTRKTFNRIYCRVPKFFLSKFSSFFNMIFHINSNMENFWIICCSNNLFALNIIQTKDT